MRVLHIGTEKTWRGGENQIRLLVEGLNRLKAVESWIAYPQKSQGLDRFRELGPVVPLPSSSSADLRSVFRLARTIKKNKIQIIDAHSSGSHSLALWVKKLVPEVKVVVHRRVDNPLLPRWSTRRKYLSPDVDQFIAISRFIGQMLLDYGVPQDKVAIVRSAVDPTPYAGLERAAGSRKWRQRYGIADGTFLLGSASALSSQKGPDILLRALGELKKMRNTANALPPFHCLIAGEGEMRRALETMIDELNLRDVVTLVGFVREVPELVCSFDVLLLPSRNEGLGTLVQEAMLARTPVIAASVGGIPEMIRHESTGLLVPPENPLALAQAMQSLMSDVGLRTRLAANARQLVESEFSLGTMVSGNLKVYGQLTQGRST